jgi:two-component system chemotaxis sensor kinase CheA
VSSGDCDRLLSAVDGLRSGLGAGRAAAPVPDVAGLISRLGRVGDARGLDGRERPETARGLRTVRLSLTFPRTARGRERRLHDLLRRLGLEAVGAPPAVGTPGDPTQVQMVALTSREIPDLQARARAVRGLRVDVAEHVDPGPEPSGPSSAESAADRAATRPADVQEGETVRVEARRVDDVLNLVGEMVVARSIIAGVSGEIESLLPEDQALRLVEAQALLARVLHDLQRSAMRMRMVPADRVFRRFARVVRDLGRQRGKAVALRIVGETTELDRGILDALEEPLLHLVRNAIDHGIEPAEERRASGKPEAAALVLRAGREGNHVVIEVLDDGRGIDTASVRARAVEKGILTAREAEAASDADLAQLVFEPGLSTAQEITETSGRGVGLDVVRRTVESLKGSVRVTASPGGGSSFLIRVPLTVAIIQALLFRAGGRDLAVPLTSVVEIALPGDLAIQSLDSRDVFRLRDQVLDLVSAGSLLELPHAVSGPGFVVVVQDGVRRFGILVDELVGEQELVIKAVHDRWVRTPLVAGASVLGDGGLVLILDIPSVYRAALAQGRISHD